MYLLWILRYLCDQGLVRKGAERAGDLAEAFAAIDTDNSGYGAREQPALALRCRCAVVPPPPPPACRLLCPVFCISSLPTPLSPAAAVPRAVSRRPFPRPRRACSCPACSRCCVLAHRPALPARAFCKSFDCSLSFWAIGG